MALPILSSAQPTLLFKGDGYTLIVAKVHGHESNQGFYCRLLVWRLVYVNRTVKYSIKAVRFASSNGAVLMGFLAQNFGHKHLTPIRFN